VGTASDDCQVCRYTEASGGKPERLASGSDDFTMFLWEPSKSSKPLQRMTGHLQLINQVGVSVVLPVRPVVDRGLASAWPVQSTAG